MLVLMVTDTGFQDAEDFPREYFLVAGEDTEGYGARRSPFDTQGPGYFGDASVVSLAQNEGGDPPEESGVTIVDGAKL